MGTPNSILKAHIRATKVSVVDLSRDLGVTPARIYQWLKGGRIPKMRIRNWIYDPATPEPIRKMARRMAGEDDRSIVEAG